MMLALFVSVAAGFCIGSGSFLEQGQENEEDQILCSESQDLYIHYRVHQGDEYQDKFPVGTPITYRCGVGYLPRDIKTWNATCRMRSDGSLYWDIDKFDCRPVSCGHPGDIRWGRLMDAVFVFPRQVRYQCNKGYRMIGDAQLYCQSDGTWNSVKPECQIVDCGPLDGIANGTVQLHSTQYGSKAEFTCNNGFKLTGTSTRTCDADGQWTDESPHCEEIWCPQPDPPEGNGTTNLGANPGNQRSGTRLEYVCPQKTVLVGSEINICQETGSWLFDPPVCTPNCVVQADHSAAVMRQTYSWGKNKVELQPGSEVAESEQRLFVQCKQGYEFIDGIGNPQQRALRCKSGAWHPPGPWCTEQPCRNFHVEGGEPEYMDLLHDQVVNFTCKPNHKLQKKPNGRTPVCKFGKIWGDVPTCKPDDCHFEDLQNLVNGGRPRQRQRTSHGSVAVYDCEPPLELEGPRRLRCSFGSWRGQPPKCVPPRKCTVPYHVGSRVLQQHWASYVVNPTELSHGTVVEEGRTGLVVQCEDGYRIRDEQLRRVKQPTLQCRNGRWYPNGPWCEKDVPPRNCTLPKRQDRFKAHHKHIRVLPLDSVPHGTKLVFHCEPVGGTILKGAHTSQCDDGQWIPEVPFCYGNESRKVWDDLYLHFLTKTYTLPGGEVYVEPNTEVLVECRSSRPVYFSSPRNAQIVPARRHGRHYVSTAEFTLLLNQRVDVVCLKPIEGNYASIRKVSVLGLHLFRCPEIPERPYLTVKRINIEVYEFSCIQGHRLQGKSRIHCLRQGVWSDPFPTCVPVIEASSARAAEPEDYNPTMKVNKSTPVVQGSEPTPANTMHHVQQGMRTKAVDATDTDIVAKPTVHTSNGKEEPDTKGDHRHNRRYEPASHPQNSPESTTNKRPVHVRQSENGLNNTQVEARETSSSRESTTGLVASVNASTQNVPMLQEVHKEVQQALDLKSRNESPSSVICAHHTDSGPCSVHANRSRPTLKSTGDNPVETAAGVASELQPTAPERHEEGDFNIYSNDNSMKPPQEVKPKAPSSSLDDLPSATGRPNVSSSADVPANPLRPGGPYEPSSTEVHPDLPSAHCTLPERTNRFKAHLKDIPVPPLHSVPHGTELRFHCEPVGEMILKGPDTSRCLNGQWIPQVPHCYGRGSRELDDIFMYFSTKAYTVPGGEVYVEPNTEVLVDCWSTTPIRLFVAAKAQTHPVRWFDGRYVLRAHFALVPGEMADIVCSKADNSSRQIRVLGHHLYRCPEIPKMDYLEVRQKNREVYEFSCHTGYRLQGKPTIHCLPQGVWSDPFPTCEPLIEASSARTTEPEDDNPINETKSTSIVEDAAGAPSPSLVSPQAQDGCHMEEFFNIASDGLVILTANTLVPLNSTFWPVCDGEGYTLVGNSSAVTCLQNGSWHIPEQMKCIEGCANFNTGPNGPTVAGRKGSYALGDSVTLSCSEGTKLQPRVERIICLGYSWSERAVPVCVPAQEKTKAPRQKKRVQSG